MHTQEGTHLAVVETELPLMACNCSPGPKRGQGSLPHSRMGLTMSALEKGSFLQNGNSDKLEDRHLRKMIKTK